MKRNCYYINLLHFHKSTKNRANIFNNIIIVLIIKRVNETYENPSFCRTKWKRDREKLGRLLSSLTFCINVLTVGKTSYPFAFLCSLRKDSCAWKINVLCVCSLTYKTYLEHTIGIAIVLFQNKDWKSRTLC